MPKKSKTKFSKYPPLRAGKNCNRAEIFRNEAACNDDTVPRESLQRFMEMFHGKIDDNVIYMVYAECFPDVDQCLESLLKLSCELDTDQGDENTSILSKESEKSTISTDATLPQSELPANIFEKSEANKISSVECDYTKPYGNEFYGTAQPYDYYQTPPVNFFQNDSGFTSSLPSSFQYNGVFPPMYYMQPPLHLNVESLPNYHNSVPQADASNYQISSYASQIKNSANSSRSDTPTSFSSKTTSSIKNGRNNFNWNTDEVKKIVEKIKMGHCLLIILRGLPGSGKSTLAKKLKFSGVVFTTDDFFCRHGKYAFDPSLLDEAHYWNQNRTREALLKKISPVIVDNTNTEAWEMLPYIKMGKKFSYEIVILEPNTPWKFKPKELAYKNRHGVPKEKITKMLARYQHNITLDNFNSTFSTSVVEGLSGSPKRLNDNCGYMTGNETSVNENSCDFLPAIALQEEQPSNILEEKDPNIQYHNISSLPKNFMLKEFPLPPNESDHVQVNEYSDNKSIVDPMNDTNEDIRIDSLEELKSLAHEDSEDSQSLGKNDPQASDQELTSWEEITEHDDDFLWKTSSSPSVSSQFQCNTLLGNEVEIKTVTQSELDLIEEKQEICHENSIECDKSSYVSSLPAPDVISIGESKSLRNNFHSFVDVLPKNEECTSNSLNSLMANICINSDAKSNECNTQQVYAHGINSDELLHEKLNIRKTDKTLSHDDKKEFLNLHDLEVKKNLDVKTTSKLNDLNNFAIQCNHQLSKHKSTKSFDESYTLQEAKTKDDKYSETNLLRSRFFSVPVLGNQHSISGEYFNCNLTNDTQHNSYNEKLFIEADIEIEKGTASDLVSRTNSAGTASFIDRLQANDLKNPPSLDGSKNHFISEDLATELSDYSVVGSSFDGKDHIYQNKEREKGSNQVANFVDPKPQRGEKISNMIFKKNTNEKKLPETLSAEQENIANVELFEEWDCATESEAKIENSNGTSEVSFTPKPKRNLQSLRKQRSPLLKHALQDMSKDWVFPQFIQHQVYKDDTSHTRNSTSYTSSDTQTELEDFIVISKIERKESFSTKYRIIDSSKIEEWNKNVTCFENSDEDSDMHVSRVAMLEKSTSTEGLKPDVEVSEKLARLNECFPHISMEDLNHLMGLCDNDETWVTNLLLDSEYNSFSKELSNTQCQNADNNVALSSTSSESNKSFGFQIFNKKCRPIENETLSSTENLDCPEKDSGSNSTTESDSVSDDGQMESNMKQSSLSSNSNHLQNLHLSLDPVFAMQLEELFGPVTSDGFASSDSSNAVVEIDLEFAKLIHSKWKDSLQNKGQSNNDNVDTESKTLGVKLSGEKNKKDKKNLTAVKKNKGETGEPLSLLEIMEMEQAVEHHKKEKLKKDRDIVTKKNRNKLYNMFPGADPMTLDEIFEAHDCCFETAVKALEEDVGNSKTTGYVNLTPKECEGYAEILNESIDSWSKSNNTSDFTIDDWVDSGEGGYCESPKTTKEVSTPSSLSTITPEAEALRARAVEHYLMQQACVRKSSMYYQRGMKPVASVYAQNASEHRRKFKEANKAASELIAEQKNATLGYFTLDLHGLYVQEAIPKLERFLRERKLETTRRPQGSFTKLTIITGQGIHSIKGPKLRPSVVQYLRSTGYFYSENQPGFLEVYINSDGSSAPRYVPKDVGYDID